MGIYVYSMRKPVKNVELGHTNGFDVFPIARLDFLVKCGDVMGNRTAKMLVMACENRFPDVPKYAVLGEKWENKMDVYRWMGAKPWGYDTPSLPMYKVGILDLPVRRIIPDKLVAMPFKYIPAGGMFTMGAQMLERFNALTIQQAWIGDEFKKGVTHYGTADSFVMDEFGEFSVLVGGMKHRYRVNHLPDYYNEWTVKVDMGADRTNELEAIYS